VHFPSSRDQTAEKAHQEEREGGKKEDVSELLSPSTRRKEGEKRKLTLDGSIVRRGNDSKRIYVDSPDPFD